MTPQVKCWIEYYQLEVEDIVSPLVTEIIETIMDAIERLPSKLTLMEYLHLQEALLCRALLESHRPEAFIQAEKKLEVQRLEVEQSKRQKEAMRLREIDDKNNAAPTTIVRRPGGLSDLFGRTK